MATEYSEKALPWPRRAAFMIHLAYCSACRAYMDQLAKTRRLLARTTLPPPAPEAETRLLTAVEHPSERA